MYKSKYIFLPVIVILYFVLFFRFNSIRWWEISSDYRFLLTEGFFIAGMLLYNSQNKDKVLYPLLFKILFGLIIVNCITCLYFRHQSIDVSLLGWESFFLLFFYPCLRKWNFSVRDWEKIVFSVYCIILIIYIYMNIFPTSKLFVLDKDLSIFSSELRVRVYSDAILFIGTLYAWNKFLVNRKKVLLLLFVISSFIIFLQGYRILIAAMLLVSIILYYRVLGFTRYSITIFAIMVVVISVLQAVPIVQDKITEISDRTEKDNYDADDAVRFLDLAYVYSDHFHNEMELIAGSGMPVLSLSKDKLSGEISVKKGFSKYSSEMSYLAATRHFFTVDLGILGLSWVAGIPFTLAFVWLLIKVIKEKVSKEYYYIGMYALMILVAGMTNAISYKHHNLIYLAVLLVILDKVRAPKANS